MILKNGGQHKIKIHYYVVDLLNNNNIRIKIFPIRIFETIMSHYI